MASFVACTATSRVASADAVDGIGEVLGWAAMVYFVLAGVAAVLVLLIVVIVIRGIRQSRAARRTAAVPEARTHLDRSREDR